MNAARLLVPASLLLLVGCASAPPEIPPSFLPHPSETGVEACFFRRLVVSFEVLDHSNLIVYAPPPDDIFHVRIEPVRNLSGKTLIAFAARGNRICGVAGDEVFFEDRRRAPRYRIKAVSLLDPEAVLLLRQRAGLSERQRPPAE
ncbi:MAG: hypothetical protein JJT85_08500 [Chromatiales bacterium]|nr:hypothetical protein [Chromatiales bacterium]